MTCMLRRAVLCCMMWHQVRFIARDAIRRQLDNDNIVLLSNLGFTAAGEVLNCNTFDVGLHAAMELNADKLICLHLDDVKGKSGQC
jgi:amino-acid N-acetyltransferase